MTVPGAHVLARPGHPITRSRRKPVLHFVWMSDYEWQVKLAAKGLAEHDNHRMPESLASARSVLRSHGSCCS